MKVISKPIVLLLLASFCYYFNTYNFSPGKCNVHLTGYVDPEFDDEVSDEEGEEEEEEIEEQEEQKPIKNKRKLESSNESAAKKPKVI